MLRPVENVNATVCVNLLSAGLLAATGFLLRTTLNSLIQTTRCESTRHHLKRNKGHRASLSFLEMSPGFSAAHGDCGEKMGTKCSIRLVSTAVYEAFWRHPIVHIPIRCFTGQALVNHHAGIAIP